MNRENKSTGQLIAEIETLRARVDELEQVERSLEQTKITLRTSEERFQLLAENAPGVIYQCRHDDCYTMLYLNDAIKELTGYPKEDFLEGRISFADLCHPDDINRINTEVDQALTQETPVQLAYRIKHASGQWRWIEDFSTTISRSDPGAPCFEGFLIDITERKQIEEAFNTPEANYHAIFNAVNDAIFVRDVDTGIILDVNQKACDLYGYTLEEMQRFDVGGMGEGTPPYTKEDALRWIKKASQEGPQLFEWRSRHKDGTLFWVEANLRQAVIGGKHVLLAAVRDITSRKDAEAARTKQQNLLRAVVDSVPGDIYAKDLQGRFVFANRILAQHTAVTSTAEMIGKTDFDFLPETLAQTFADQEQHIMQTGRPMINHKVFSKRQTNDGVSATSMPTKDVWLMMTKVPWRDSNGEVIGLVGVNIDITERKQVDERLRLLSSAVEQSNEGIAVSDLDGNILFVNNAFAHMHGYAPEEIIGKHLSIFHTSDQMPSFEAATQQLRETGAFIGETWHVRSNGTVFPTMMQNSILRDESGKPSGMIATLHDITERKQDENALREAEERYRAVFEQAVDTIVLLNPKTGSILEFNERAFENLGYTRVEFEKLTLADIEAVESAEETALHLRTVANKGADTFATKHKHKNGELRDIVVSCRIISVRGKRLICAIWRDITERKWAETALRASQAGLYALIENTEDVILSLNREQQLVTFNSAYAQVIKKAFGVDIKAGMKVNELHPKEQQSWWKGRNQRALAGERFVDEFTHDFGDGDIHTYEVSFNPIIQDGEVTGLSQFTKDITDRKQAEEALQSEREFLKTLLENLSEGIVACDADGRLTLFNRASREFHKTTEKATPADQWAERYDLYHPDGLTPLKKEEIPLYRALQGEHIRNVEIVIAPEKGRARTLRTSGNAIITPDNKKLGAVVAMHDVTEQNELQRQLLQSQKLESMGTLAGGIAHDFNNLLAVIMGNASVHLRDQSLPDKLRESLLDIMDASERGSSLTHQLLAYARSGLQKPVPADLNHIVESVLKMLRRTAPAGIEFALNLKHNLPSIIADPSQIEQVVMNLCLNAIQATQPPNTIEITSSKQRINARLAATLEIEPGAYVCLQVKDYGCGMDAKTAERIFEPFFTTKPTGRGMGLSATHGIIVSHRGAIRAESTPGTGTTLSVWLPRASKWTRPRLANAISRPDEPPHGSETILVIDDDPAVNRTVEQILASLGYCIVGQTDPEEATTFMDTNAEDIDMIILNLNTPKCSPAEMITRIMKRCPNAPILLESGHDEPDLVQQLIQQGAAGFLPKPFSLPILANAVRKTLDQPAKHN